MLMTPYGTEPYNINSTECYTAEEMPIFSSDETNVDVLNNKEPELVSALNTLKLEKSTEYTFPYF